MSSSSSSQIFLLLLSLILTFSTSNSSHFVVPIAKDASTLQYLATIHRGNPLSPTTLVLDLNAPVTWTDCDSEPESSSSRRIIPRGSIQCLAAKSESNPNRNDYYDDRCALTLANEIGRVRGRGDLVEDIVAVDSVDRSTVKILLGCSATRKTILKGLARGAQGILGLGKARVSLPSQISSQQHFTMCLSSSNGVVSIEDGFLNPYFGSRVSKSLVYTPILSLTDAESTGRDYFINVKSVNIGGKKLSIDIETAKLSTVVPYTAMESSIYGVFAEAYEKAASSMNMTRVGSFGPFGLCFGPSSETNGPEIELVLQSELVKLRLGGRNSLVRVGKGVTCLGFLDGGSDLEASLVLGGYQLEERVLHFDVGNSMLGFSPSLLKWEKTCSDFTNSGSSTL